MLPLKNNINTVYQDLEGQPSFPVLPGKMQRGELEGLMLDVSKLLGMSDSLLKSLLAMMRETRPSDWIDTGRDPTCFAMQCNIAFMLGKDARSVRRDEAALERQFGFIRKNVAGNGSRCRFKIADGIEFSQGISFSPLIELVPELLQLRENMRFERQHTTRLKRKCSALRRNAKKTLMDFQADHPDNADLTTLAKSYLSWPRRYAVFGSLEALEAHYAEVLAASELADELRQIFTNMSGQAGAGVRPYIQDTTEDPFVTCNAGVSEGPNCKSEANANPSACAKLPASQGLENKDDTSRKSHNSEFMNKLSPQRLFFLSSEEMQFYISHHQGQKAVPSAMDFIQASIDRLGELDINRSAYFAAQEQMGDMATALCVLIIDRNRFHPETPIQNPGGVLRAMTKRHAAGVLNIVGSLVGLSERGKLKE